MKFSKSLLPTLLTGLLVSAVAVSANQPQASSDYQVIYMKDCQIVAEHDMTNEQIDAYLALEAEEEKMHELEAPIQAIEQQLQVFTDEIESLSELAVQETETSVYIDKTYLKQQEEVADRLDAFMEEHEHAFDALGDQGEVIGEKAEAFEDTLDLVFGGIDYNQIQVSTPGNPASGRCYKHGYSFSS